MPEVTVAHVKPSRLNQLITKRIALYFMFASAVAGGLIGAGLRDMLVKPAPVPTPPAATIFVTPTPTPLLDCPEEDSCPPPILDYRNRGWYANGVRVTR